MLAKDDVDAYVDHLAAHDLESGTEGDLPSGPYSANEPEDKADVRSKALRRWATPLDALGWRRAWGLWEGGRVVGSVHLAGADLRAAMHRVDCGIGIERPHRGHGHGRRLMHAAIDWARNQPSIDWIDLGVFEGNDIASALYESLGFERLGRTPDRFRVDGLAITDIQMALHVAG